MNTEIESVTKEMTSRSREILLAYASEYMRGENLSNLRFFSYGSNMNEVKFVEDTRRMGYGFGLGNAQKRVLKDYWRILGNSSRNHGLAFTIRAHEGVHVEGICHDIPIKGLRSFLKKEGVLTRRPNYELIMVSVSGEDHPVLTLKGLRPANIEKLGIEGKQKVLRYVRITIEGAERWKVDCSDLLELKKLLERDLQTAKE